MCRFAKRQRGVALITILLIFALVTMMATDMARSGYLAMRRTANLRDAGQAQFYALGGEELARQILYADFQQDKRGQAADHLGESWAEQLETFEIDQGQIEMGVQDLQSRFNLNNLLGEKDQLDQRCFERLKRLLAYLDLSSSLAEGIRDLMRVSGSGKNIVLRPLLDVSELRNIAGLEHDEYELLRQNVTVLASGTRINLNTATEAVIIAHTDINRNLAEMERIVHNLLNQREKKPIFDVDAFVQSGNGSVFKDSADFLSVTSSNFVVGVKAVYAGRRAYVETQLLRDPESGELEVLRRSSVPTSMVAS